jgi:hypothetical protein
MSMLQVLLFLVTGQEPPAQEASAHLGVIMLIILIQFSDELLELI